MLIYLVSKNSGKLAAARYIFDRYGIELRPVDRDYPEIQADTSLEIARYTALAAAKDFGHPAVREDHSLFISALGLPGPFTSYFEKHIPALRLLELLRPYTDRTGFFEIATVYADPGGSTKEFIYRVPIHITTEERGTLQSGWSRLLVLEGESRTFAEYPETERLSVWSKNYEAIAVYVSQSGKAR